jgi:hypothetical protein
MAEQSAGFDLTQTSEANPHENSFLSQDHLVSQPKKVSAVLALVCLLD